MYNELMESNFYSCDMNYRGNTRYKTFLARAVCVILVIFLISRLWPTSKNPASMPSESNTMTIDDLEVTSITSEEVLQAIGELNTYEATYSGTAKIEQARQIDDHKIPGTTHTITFAYTGVIKVGYDFSSIEVNVDNSRKIIYVTLPMERVVENCVDVNDISIQVENNIFNPADTQSEIAAYMEVEKEARLQEAIDSGLYRSAEANAKQLIRGCLNDFNGYTVDFKIRSDNR